MGDSDWLIWIPPYDVAWDNLLSSSSFLVLFLFFSFFVWTKKELNIIVIYKLVKFVFSGFVFFKLKDGQILDLIFSLNF